VLVRRLNQQGWLKPGDNTMLEHGWMSIATVMGTLTIAGACAVEPTIGESEEALLLEEVFDEIPNNVWLPNAAGFAATYSTQGLVDLRVSSSRRRGPTGGIVDRVMPSRTGGRSGRRRWSWSSR
jgi:hypothetical protein